METNAAVKWSYTTERHTEGYTFDTWNWYTGATIIFGQYFYRSLDAAVVAMVAQMVNLGYDRNEMR